ncbi:Nuclear receptor corepressor 1 [Linum perenne]
MPPEPFSLDRKKHERSESSSSSLGSAPRWREWSSGHYGSYREFGPRWAGGSGDFRRPSGHGKQGSWHLFPEESGYGYTRSRSSDRMQENENGRLPLSRADGKYGRTSRDNRGPSGPRDWKTHSWEMSNGSQNGPGRFHDVNNHQRSIDDMLTHPPSHPVNSDFVNTWNQLQLKEHNNCTNEGGINVLSSGQSGEKASSLDWKPLKWARGGSLSSRGSGIRHSSSSKSLGALDCSGGKNGVMPLNDATSIQSPSGDVAAADGNSVAPSDETTSRKKPRLRWGEGLAKFEKRRVEGPEISGTRDDNLLFATNADPGNSQSSSLADRSPRLMDFSDSPATPSSVACSSSPGIEEKLSGKALGVDNGASNLCGSPHASSQSHLEELSLNVEKLDSSLITSLGSSLTEMIQSDNLCSVDSTFVKLTGMKKLLVWKGDVLKALETTESEIDVLENELKLLKSDSKSKLSCPSSSSSLSSGDAIICNELKNSSGDVLHRPPSLKVVSSRVDIVHEIHNSDDAFEDGGGSGAKDGIDSPGTATSKFAELVPLVEDSSDMLICSENADLGPMMHEKKTAVSACKVDVLDKNNNPISASTSSVADGKDNLCAAILALNKVSASAAVEEFSRLLPSDPCSVDYSKVASKLSLQTDALIKQKFLMMKRPVKFKEKVVALKFKAFQHLWREDMKSLCVKKCKAKSQKKLESSLRPILNMDKKHRSSSRMRVCLSGNIGLVPTSSMLNFTSKLLADCNVKVFRDKLKMPAQILDDKEKVVSRFISSNGLVEDPCAVERERAMINLWTLDERQIFIDKLASCGKDFKKIASFLEHKTTADCVEFYYKNHKSDSFGKLKKNKQSKSSTNYLMSSSKKWNSEMNAAPLDILGAASVMAADSGGGMGSSKMHSSRILIRGYNDCTILEDDDCNSDKSNNYYDMIVNEKETVAADVLAGISGSVSSCITTTDHGEGFRERKAQKRNTADRCISLSDATHSVDAETCSDESCGEMDPAGWTDEEKSAFVRAVSLYGKDFALISRCVRTRSQEQCKVFFSKTRKCLGLDQIQSGNDTAGPSLSDDANGGGSDMEHGYAVEKGLSKLPSEVDRGLPPSVMCTTKCEVSDGRVRLNLDTNLQHISQDKNVSGEMEEAGLVDTDVLVSDCPNDHLLQSSKLADGEVINGSESSMKAQKVPVESGVIKGEKDCGANDGFADSGIAGDVVDSGPSNMVSFFEDEAMKEDAVKKSESGLGDQESSFSHFKASSQSCFIQDLNATKEVPHPPWDMGSSNDSHVLENINKRQVEVNSVETSAAMSLLMESNIASTDYGLQEPAVGHCHKVHDSSGILASVDVHENGDREDGKSSYKNGYAQPLLSHSIVNDQGSPQISTSCTLVSDAEHLKSEPIIAKQLVAEGCHLQKYSYSEGQCSRTELTLRSGHSEQSNRQSLSLSDTGKPCKTGDLRLFGKILSCPVSSQKPTTACKNDDKGIHHVKTGTPLTLNFTGHPSADGNATSLNFDPSNCAGIENLPPRSYGFWDGRRIQTGLPSLPDSAILLAKYPAAFANYQGDSSKIDQTTLHTVLKNSERIINGLPTLNSRDASSGNALLDFQRYMTNDVNKFQPFAVERHDVLDLQGRKGFDSIPSLQQQGRAVGMGMSIAGRGGVLIGGPCQAISDPVAAIKMHFAKTDQFGVQNGAINARPDEAWRGKGDVKR